MPRSEERGGMAARSEAEINSLLVYKSPARQGGVLYFFSVTFLPTGVRAENTLHGASLLCVAWGLSHDHASSEHLDRGGRLPLVNGDAADHNRLTLSLLQNISAS